MNMIFNFLKGELINGKVNLEKTVRGVGVGLAEDFVFEIVELRMRLAVLVEATLDMAVLVGTEEEGLILPSLFATGSWARVKISGFSREDFSIGILL